MSELLTPEEMRVIYCDAQYASAVDAWEAIAKAQLAKCKERHAVELEHTWNESKQATESYYEAYTIPARIAEERAKWVAEVEKPDVSYVGESYGVPVRIVILSRWQSIKELGR